MDKVIDQAKAAAEILQNYRQQTKDDLFCRHFHLRVNRNDYTIVATTHPNYYWHYLLCNRAALPIHIEQLDDYVRSGRYLTVSLKEIGFVPFVGRLSCQQAQYRCALINTMSTHQPLLEALALSSLHFITSELSLYRHDDSTSPLIVKLDQWRQKHLGEICPTTGFRRKLDLLAHGVTLSGEDILLIFTICSSAEAVPKAKKELHDYRAYLAIPDKAALLKALLAVYPVHQLSSFTQIRYVVLCGFDETIDRVKSDRRGFTTVYFHMTDEPKTQK